MKHKAAVGSSQSYSLSKFRMRGCPFVESTPPKMIHFSVRMALPSWSKSSVCLLMTRVQLLKSVLTKSHHHVQHFPLGCWLCNGALGQASRSASALLHHPDPQGHAPLAAPPLAPASSFLLGARFRHPTRTLTSRPRALSVRVACG